MLDDPLAVRRLEWNQPYRSRHLAYDIGVKIAKQRRKLVDLRRGRNQAVSDGVVSGTFSHSNSFYIVTQNLTLCKRCSVAEKLFADFDAPLSQFTGDFQPR